jgi:hypothetical protein
LSKDERDREQEREREREIKDVQADRYARQCSKHFADI